MSDKMKRRHHTTKQGRPSPSGRKEANIGAAAADATATSTPLYTADDGSSIPQDRSPDRHDRADEGNYKLEKDGKWQIDKKKQA
ncbi:hypothetical protein IMSHALPRED_005840 [Imshaugia aleurites]|uniref:Uncharacterized protein n=1 Tax=Imshaugia aleurites TaxID=172621 RepID=A0A8H3FG45_9LECA|nr:hypothetical protein IMSHALPRED_005840 [Imshaugia aleurites]